MPTEEAGRSRVIAPLAAAGVAAPPIAALVYILTFGVNTVFSDQLRLAPYFDAMARGALTPQIAFELNNEHRVFFPRLTSLALGRVTQLDTVVEMVVGWGLLVVALGILWRAWRRSAGSHVTLAAFVPVSAMLFGWRQHEVFLRGDGLPTYMSLAGFLASTLFLVGAGGLGPRFALALAAATFASFSYLNGLLVWPVGAGLLASRVRAEPRAHTPMLLAWLAVGACVTLTYFAGYTKPQHHPPLTHVFQQPIVALRYFLIATGGPLASDVHSSLGVGAAVFALQVVASALAIRTWRLAGRQPSYGLCLIAFAVASQVLITVGRSGFGAEQAISSRYTPFAMLGVIGTYFIFADARTTSREPWVRGALLLMIGAGLITAYSNGLDTGRAERHNRLTLAYLLRTYRVQTDRRLLQVADADAKRARRNAAILERLKLNVFATSIDPAKIPDGPGGVMSLDAVNGRAARPDAPVVIADDAEVVFEGWAVDSEAKRPAAEVFAIIDDGQLVIPAGPGIARPDVADHFRISSYERAGFRTTFAATLLLPGTHTVRFAVLSADRRRITRQPHVYVLTRAASGPSVSD